MGYAHYKLSDGREAGYAVEAECDRPECGTKITRGFGFLCGGEPLGQQEEGRAGCANYYCGRHQNDHGCPAPACGEWDAEEMEECVLLTGHELPHISHEGTHFTETYAEVAA